MVELGNDDEDQIEEIQVDLDHLDHTLRIKTCLSAEATEKIFGFFKEMIHISLHGMQKVCR